MVLASPRVSGGEEVHFFDIIHTWEWAMYFLWLINPSSMSSLNLRYPRRKGNMEINLLGIGPGYNDLSLTSVVCQMEKMSYIFQECFWPKNYQSIHV
jgi:hypothetical protein